MTYVASHVGQKYFSPSITYATESRSVATNWFKALSDTYETPVTTQWLSRQFHELAETWRQERGPTSSLSKVVSHPAYHRVISLGKDAVPLILKELQRRPDYWFAALSAITGANPVRPEQRGRLHEMTQAWVQWGIQNGYL